MHLANILDIWWLPGWAIFIFLFVLIIIFAFLILFYKKFSISRQNKMFRDLYSKSPYRKTNTLPKRTDEFLMREQRAERALESGKDLAIKGIAHVKKMQRYGEREIVNKKGRIVGLAKPVGFWSRFIMGQKMSYIMARLGMGSKTQHDQGFWVNLIKAQDIGKGRSEGRGR